MAIVGCGNFHYSSKLQVPLTSVDQRSREIGERTAKMIMTLLEKPTSARPRTVDSGAGTDCARVVEDKIVSRPGDKYKNVANVCTTDEDLSLGTLWSDIPAS